MRPATPPRFMLEVAQGSIDRMIELAPRYMVFGHYGMVATAVEHLQIARNQLHLWVKGVAQTQRWKRSDGSGIDAVADGARWELQQHQSIAGDIQARERYFFGNTMRGMAEYVAALTEEERAR